jgi:hypothetical protein
MRTISAVAVAGVVVALAMAIFGLPPVDLHGPLHRNGIMDPFCGGTRAARLTMRGELATAWRYNPLGIVSVLVGVLGMLRLAVGLATRRWLNVELTWTPARRRWLLGAALVALALLEVRQQGRAELLMRPY